MSAEAEAPGAERPSPPPRPRVRVRPLLPGDVERVVALLARQEFMEGHSPDALRRCFDYPWTPDRPHAGFVLVAGDEVVGCLGAIFSTRTVGGREHAFVNTTAWYVEPPFRAYGMMLVAAILGLKGRTLVTLSASSEVAAVLERVGFEVVGSRLLFFGPLSRPVALGRRAELLEGAAELSRVLRGEQLRVFQDHLPFRCGQYVVREGDRLAHVVTAIRWEKGWFLPRALPARLRERRYPVTDVLHVSDPELALRHWGRLRWRMMRRERSVGVTVQDSFLGAAAPAAPGRPHRVHALRPPPDRRAVDALYSEFVLLATGHGAVRT